ncbi:MAG: hypothetical protein RIS34_143, partial [Pseudomonadota bacterium]
QPLWATGIGRAGVQNGFHQGEFGCAIGQVVAADHIAHNKHVGLERELVCTKAFDQIDAQGAQLVAHGRVDTGVAAGYTVPGLARQRSQPTHERAANAKNMNMHAVILGEFDKILASSPRRYCASSYQKCSVREVRFCTTNRCKILTMDSLTSEISAAAARMVVEEGLEYGPAKRRAVKHLGLSNRTALPGNDAIEEAVRDYISLFLSDTQPMELLALRQLALVWMTRMAQFRPHLGGAVWRGTATRRSDIYIQLFCDDPKSAEIALIDFQVSYVPRTVTGFTGGSVEALSVHSFCQALGEEVGVHLLIYDYDDLRGALKPEVRGSLPARAQRGDMAAVRVLLHDAQP